MPVLQAFRVAQMVFQVELKYNFAGCVNYGCHGDSAEKKYKYKIKGFQAVICCHYLTLGFVFVVWWCVVYCFF